MVRYIGLKIRTKVQASDVVLRMKTLSRSEKRRQMTDPRKQQRRKNIQRDRRMRRVYVIKINK